MLWVWFVVQRTGMGSKVSGLRMKTMAECHAASLDGRGLVGREFYLYTEKNSVLCSSQ